MRYIPAILATLAIGWSTAAQAQRVDLDEADLVLRFGETVDAVINEQPVRFRVDPDAISVPTVNADTAARLDLDASMIGYKFVIGPVQLPFSTDTVRYDMQGDRFRRRTAFSDRQLFDNVDGVAGPNTFPHRRTVLHLRDTTEQDGAIVLPLDKEMGRSQTGTVIEVGGHPVYVAFSFARPESMVSATGGRWIADAYGGFFEGEARMAPILYGVERPVRPLALGEPLMLGPLEIRNLVVRVSDMGDASTIAEGAAPDVDLNEIVVTAGSGRDIPSQRLYVGLDTIGHCASITYDFEAETITLMCPDQPEG